MKYAIRTLWKAPGFSLVAIATIALGIGVNTAIFSIVHGVLLRPLPFPDEAHIVKVSTRGSDGPAAGLLEVRLYRLGDRSNERGEQIWSLLEHRR